jgi:hypothetical protein
MSINPIDEETIKRIVGGRERLMIPKSGKLSKILRQNSEQAASIKALTVAPIAPMLKALSSAPTEQRIDPRVAELARANTNLLKKLESLRYWAIHGSSAIDTQLAAGRVRACNILLEKVIRESNESKLEKVTHLAVQLCTHVQDLRVIAGLFQQVWPHVESYVGVELDQVKEAEAKVLKVFAEQRSSR